MLSSHEKVLTASHLDNMFSTFFSVCLAKPDLNENEKIARSNGFEHQFYARAKISVEQVRKIPVSGHTCVYGAAAGTGHDAPKT